MATKDQHSVVLVTDGNRGIGTWATWVPVTKAKLALCGNPKRSVSHPPATSSMTASAGPQAGIAEF